MLYKDRGFCGLAYCSIKHSLFRNVGYVFGGFQGLSVSNLGYGKREICNFLL